MPSQHKATCTTVPLYNSRCQNFKHTASSTLLLITVIELPPLAFYICMPLRLFQQQTYCYVCYCRLLSKCSFLVLRISENSPCYSHWFCHHGIHWVFCQTHPHSHQQHHSTINKCKVSDKGFLIVVNPLTPGSET